MTLVTTLFALSALADLYGAVDVGKYLKTCDRNSEDVNDCLVDAIQAGIVAAVNGIPEFGVPPIDPYHQNKLRVDYTLSQIKLKANNTDLYFYGIKSSKIQNIRFKAEEDNFNLEVDVTTPRLFVTGKSSGETWFNLLRFGGTGQFNLTFTNMVDTWKIHGTPEKKDRETYMKIDSFYVRPDVSNMHIGGRTDNEDNQELANLTMEFVNLNWKMLYKEFLPFLSSVWAKIGKRVANKIFKKVPYDQLFPAKS